ncbi:MAG: 6-bladed beta-propeller [Bacteroidales bacterium]|nr:6-bladed beta-propeller [Bacteroidales bacterium]
MSIKISFLIISVFVFTAGFSQKATQSDKFLDVNIDKIKTVEAVLSEFVESCEVIRLETNLEGLLNAPMDIAISDDYILITDIGPHTAKLFTRNGQYVRELGFIGKGPAEYNTVVSPYIAPDDPFFWIMVGGNYAHPKEGWIYQFDSNGKFVKEFDANAIKSDQRNANRILVYKNQLLIPGNAHSENILTCKDLLSEKIRKIPNPIPKDHFTYMTNNSTVYPRGDNYILMVGEADTIYKYNPERKSIQAIAAITTKYHKYDKKKITAARRSSGSGRFAAIQKATEGGYSIQILGETKDYYLLMVRVMGKRIDTKLCRVNRVSSKAEFYTLKNDLFGNLPLTSSGYFYQNEFLIYNFSTIDLKDLLSKAIKNNSASPEWIKKLLQLNSEINEDDNNVLFVCRLKL